jgi:hypothetical protein
MEPLYRAWNCDYRVVASAGEDAFPNFYRSYIIGSNRVYVNSGKKLDYDKWIADFRAGRSFVTSGPLIFFTVDSQGPGGEIKLGAGGREMKAVVEVESITPVETVELLYNNKVIETRKPEGKPLRYRFEKTVSAPASGWFAVRVRSAYARHPIRRPFPFAATMPVWISVGGKRLRSRQDAEYFVGWIDKTLARALALPSWNNEKEREETRKLYAEARARMIQRRDETR